MRQRLWRHFPRLDPRHPSPLEHLVDLRQLDLNPPLEILRDIAELPPNRRRPRAPASPSAALVADHAPVEPGRYSRSRSSPVIIPPSFVATIFLRIVSTCADRGWSRAASVSTAASAGRRAASEPRTSVHPVDHRRHLFEHAIERHGEVELRLPVRPSRASRAGRRTTVSIVEYCRSPSVSLTVYRPGSKRGPMQNAGRPRRAPAAAACVIDQATRLDPAPLARRQRGHELARRVAHLELHVAEDVALLQVVRDHRVAGRIRPHERRVAVRPPADRRGCAAPPASSPRNARRCASVAGVSCRSGVMSSMIQIPRPCVAITRSLSRGWIARSRTATPGSSPPVYRDQCCPPSTDTQSPNSVPEKQQLRVDQILLDHVRVPAHRRGVRRRDERVQVVPKSVDRYAYGRMSPNVCRSNVAYTVPRRSAPPRRSSTHALFGSPGDVADDVGPGFAAVPGQLQVAVVGARPDDLRILRRFGDREDRGVHLGGGVVHRDAA